MPLSSAQEGLVELMQAICQLRADQAGRATGWSVADAAAAETVLADIAEGDRTTRPARETIPALFKAADPLLEQRFATSLAALEVAYQAFRAEVAA